MPFCYVSYYNGWHLFRHLAAEAFPGRLFRAEGSELRVESLGLELRAHSSRFRADGLELSV